MQQITLLYTPQFATMPPDPGGAFELFRATVGYALAAGWEIADFSPEPIRIGYWRMTLRHGDDSYVDQVRQILTAVRNPNLELFDAGSMAYAPPPPVYVPPPPPVIQPITLPIPREVPAALRETDAELGKRAAMRGIIAGIVMSLATGLLAPAKSAPQLMFDPRTPSALVTTAILCLLLWGVFYGLTRQRRLSAIGQLNGTDLLPAILSGLKTHGADGVLEALKGDAVQYSPLLRRVRLILEQWMLRPNLANANIVVEQQVVADREATQSGYTLLRIFVWATPVLGLIGTVVGISIAVGGFAAFLSTNVEDIAKIKEGLVGVTGGLSFAFLITLEGLLSSLVLMLFTSNLQTREERLYAGIEVGISEGFLPELQRVAPEQEGAAGGSGTVDWSGAMAEPIRRVMDVIESAGNRILAKWDEQHKDYVSGVAAAGGAIERSAQNVAAMFQNSSSAMVTQMAEFLAAQRGAVDRMLEGLKRNIESSNAEVSRSAQTVVVSFSGAAEGVGAQMKTVLGAFDEAAARHRAATQEAFSESARASAGYAAEITRSADSIRELGKVTAQVLATQASLHTAMAQIGDSRLANLMAELDSSLRELKPVLSNLSHPFVWQAVPVPARSGESGPTR